MEWNMEWVSLFIRMKLGMKVRLSIIQFKVMEYLKGRIIYMKAVGNREKCMAQEKANGIIKEIK